VQAAKATNAAGGADTPAVTVPAAQAPRGALGGGGLRSQDDALRGIEGGFLVDVFHGGGPTGIRNQGDPVPPRYAVGIDGALGVTSGFKRSKDPADIRSAGMYDFPGTDSAAANVDFSFESIARGEDTMITYGGLRWGFGLRAGHVIRERYDTVNATSATFDETLERFRDFYVHEPVVLYFEFDRDVLNAVELAKIDSFIIYLGRNPNVVMSIEGLADIHGGASARNRALARSRAEAVAAAILARRIAPTRISAVTVGSGGAGISTLATADAGTGDQGGNAAVGADQTREANRWANRRVVVTFSQTASVLRPLAGGTGP